MTPQPRPASPLLTGAVNGAVSGLIAFVIFVLINHFLFDRSESHRHGLIPTLIAVAILGVVFGAILGAVVALTRNLLIAIVAGAILLALIRLLASGDTSPLNIIMGLIYGAIFGYVVASAAARSLDATGT